MKKLLYIIISILALSSCNYHRESYDFGEFVFDDPFYGIKKEYRWSLLEKSLECPPFSWFVDDSVNYETYKFNATFNDECLKYKTPVDFALADSNKNVITGLTIDCDGVVTTNGHFQVIPKTEEQEVDINVQIPFEVGDTVIKGLLMVSGENLEEINEKQLSGVYEPIGGFSVSQDFSPNWTIWFMWLAILLFILWLLYLLFHFLYIKILEQLLAIVLVDTASRGVQMISEKYKESKEKKEQKKKNKEEEKKDEEEKEFYMYPYEGVKYEEGIDGVRVLVVTASQYCPFRECQYFLDCTKNCAKYNKECRNVCPKPYPYDLDEDTQATWKDGHPTYNKFFNCILYKSKPKIVDKKKRDELYHHVDAYLFYHQILPSYGKFAPTPSYNSECEKFNKYYNTFVNRLLPSIHSPELIVVWGDPVKDALKANIPIISQINDGTDRNYKVVINGREYIICFFTHPSSTVSLYETNCHEAFWKAIEHAKELR